LVPGEGYFLYVRAGEGTYFINTPALTEAVPLDISTGWNFVGLPVTSLANAQELCASLDTNGFNPGAVAVWSGDGYRLHICGLPFGNFFLEPVTPVFLLTGTDGIFTP
jgi:hypothetical protein